MWHSLCKFLCFSVLVSTGISSSSQTVTKRPSRACARLPESLLGRRNGDDNYSLDLLDAVSKTPVDTFEPSAIYTLRLIGTKRFQQFFLVAVPRGAISENESIGRFVLNESQSVRSVPDCPKVVTNSGVYVQVREVYLHWKAPPKDTRCAEFRATVVESADSWVKDDGKLTLSVCRAPSRDEVVNLRVNSGLSCCACETATYEMQFYGKWTRNSHPKMFPEADENTRWSSIIGASHDSNYLLWHLGGYSSPGVRDVCERGNTSTIERELFRNRRRNIRSIIKTSEIFEKVGSLKEPRYAVFSVNKTHHFVSLLASPKPSPDWCVGVSALNLCQPNCTWAKNVTIDLFLWDAGTNNGVSYASTGLPTTPSEKITPIRFKTLSKSQVAISSDSSHSKPFATIKFVRKFPFVDACAANGNGAQDDTAKNSILHKEQSYGRKKQNLRWADANETVRNRRIDVVCKLTQWSDWSACSASCGDGVKTRSRRYLHSAGYFCNEKATLDETKFCKANLSCTLANEAKNQNEAEVCVTSPWNSWSSCSVTCGSGIQYRRRRIIKGAQNSIRNQLCQITMQSRECYVAPCIEECRFDEWSAWSSCANACRNGTQDRFRLPISSGRNDSHVELSNLCRTERQRRDCHADPDCELLELGG